MNPPCRPSSDACTSGPDARLGWFFVRSVPSPHILPKPLGSLLTLSSFPPSFRCVCISLLPSPSPRGYGARGGFLVHGGGDQAHPDPRRRGPGPSPRRPEQTHTGPRDSSPKGWSARGGSGRHEACGALRPTSQKGPVVQARTPDGSSPRTRPASSGTGSAPPATRSTRSTCAPPLRSRRPTRGRNHARRPPISLRRALALLGPPASRPARGSGQRRGRRTGAEGAGARAPGAGRERGPGRSVSGAGGVCLARTFEEKSSLPGRELIKSRRGGTRTGRRAQTKIFHMFSFLGRQDAHPVRPRLGLHWPRRRWMPRSLMNDLLGRPSPCTSG